MEQASQSATQSLQMPPFTFNSSARAASARLGKLVCSSQRTVLTPNFIATTSRGAIPHMTPDVQAQHTKVQGVYLALEDFVEKVPPKEPPILQIPPLPGVSRLRRYTAQPSDSLLVLGPRRLSPIDSPTSNADDAIAIYTSVGFRKQRIEEYVRAASIVEPDVLIGPADIVWAASKSQKRIQKMSDRTERWMQDLLQNSNDLKIGGGTAVFAPILPLPYEQQRYYVESLQASADHLAGLAFYDVMALSQLPTELSDLVRLSLSASTSPHGVLQQVQAGIDLCAIPFVTVASDAGIALAFAFPPPQKTEMASMALTPLGINMFAPEHSTDTGAMSTDSGCECYACTTMTRAYIQHLLSAKEMTGWVMLQVHNHAVMDRFFAGIRHSIEQGTFAQDATDFGNYYEAQLPIQTGAGPRVRGYQYKSSGPDEKKRNPRAFDAKLGNGSGKTEAIAEATTGSATVSNTAGAEELEDHGLTSKVD